MITLITGLPGSGKTLKAIELVGREWPQAEKFHDGIKDLALPWGAADALKWYELPPGSVCVVDEAQRKFRPRGTGSKVPRHVEELETIRHTGHELVLTTQHPKFLDANVRRLVTRHLHMVRVFGAELANVHEWAECCPDPDLSRTDSITTQWRYPKALYSAYKSAEMHTIKRRIPGRVMFLAALPLLIAALGYVAWASLDAFTPAANAPEHKAGPQENGLVAGVTRAVAGAASPVSYAESYIRRHVPAVPGLAYTAQAYEEVTRPRVAPAPVACIATDRRCECYTQQATRLPDVDDQLCRAIVSNGMFIAWEQPAPPGTIMPADSVRQDAAARVAVVASAPTGQPAVPATLPPATGTGLPFTPRQRGQPAGPAGGTGPSTPPASPPPVELAR